MKLDIAAILKLANVEMAKIMVIEEVILRVSKPNWQADVDTFIEQYPNHKLNVVKELRDKLDCSLMVAKILVEYRYHTLQTNT